MLEITRAANREVVFAVSGRLDVENLAELKTLIDAEAGGRQVSLDLRELLLSTKTLSVFSCAAKPTTSSLRIVQHTSANGSRQNEVKVSGSSGYKTAEGHSPGRRH
jgi:hypothetical protein